MFGITFDIKYLIVFLTGIVFGFLFLGLLYVYSILISLRKKTKRKRQVVEIDSLEIELMIKNAQKEFKNKELRKEVGYFTHLKEVLLSLSLDIAKKYYPKSKTPLLELTVEESLLLTHYISDRLNELLSARMLRPLKRRTLTQFKTLYDAKVKVEESKVVEVGKSVKAGKVARTFFNTTNLLNPAYWIKRVTTDKLYGIIIMRISCALIAITGEETYKIYSKSFYQEPEALDIDLESYYENIESGDEL